MLTTLFLMQSAVSADLTVAPAVPRCTNTNPDEIVVCGSRDLRRYRLDPLPEQKSGLGTAERMIGGAKVGIVAEQGEVGGITTNRAMVRLKIKF